MYYFSNKFSKIVT